VWTNLPNQLERELSAEQLSALLKATPQPVKPQQVILLATLSYLL
jgi:hypothetical protein